MGVTVLVILNSLRLLRFEMDHSSERQPMNLQYGVNSGNGSGPRDAIGR